MTDSGVVQPLFHIYDDFFETMPAPPEGRLKLGSIIRGFDYDDIWRPLDIDETFEPPNSQLRPIDKPFEMNGFSRSLNELKGLKGNVNWGTITGREIGSEVGIISSLLCSIISPLRNITYLLLRKDKDKDKKIFLMVEKLQAQYFFAPPEYINRALEIDGVASYIEETKRKKPVYMITGLLWTERAAVGHTVYGYRDLIPFVLGFRVRKIWWDSHGIRCEAEEDEFGATLDDFSAKDKENLENV